MKIYSSKTRSAVRASKADCNRRSIRAEEEVNVAPEASELIMDTEDVADLLAEVTGEDVTVEATDEALEFQIGEDVFTVEPDEDEEVEVLESNRRALRNKRPVAANKNTRRPAPRKITRR